MPNPTRPFQIADVYNNADKWRDSRTQNALRELDIQQGTQIANDQNTLRTLTKQHSASGVPDYEAISRSYVQQTGDIGTADQLGQMPMNNTLAKMDFKVKGMTWVRNAGSMVQDQSTYDAFRQQAEQFKVAGPGELPAQYDPNFMQNLVMKSDAEIKKLTVTSGDQQQDVLVQGGNVIERGEMSPRWQPRQTRTNEIYDPDSPTGSRIVPADEAIGKPGKMPGNVDRQTANQRDVQAMVEAGVFPTEKAAWEAIKSNPKTAEIVRITNLLAEEQKTSGKFPMDDGYKTTQQIFEEARNIVEGKNALNSIPPPPTNQQSQNTGAPQNTGAQQYQEGTIYEDASGNKARYVNGQWEEVE